MRHGLAAAFLQRQAGLGSVQGLDLALLIDPQHQRMLGRIQIQADDFFQLVGKLRIATYFESLDQMRLESVRAPDAPHAGLGDTHFARHGARGPMRRVGRSGLRGLPDHLLTIAAGIDGVRPGRGASFSRPSTPRSRNLPRHKAAMRGLIFNSSRSADSAYLRRPATQCGCATLRAPAQSAHALAAQLPTLRVQNDRLGNTHDRVSSS